MRNDRNINPSWTVSSSIRVAPRCSPASDCGQSVTNFGFNLETTKEKEMKISQTYPAALIATHTNDSAPQKPKSARRGLMQRLGFAFLACALAIGATGTASAGNLTRPANFQPIDNLSILGVLTYSSLSVRFLRVGDDSRRSSRRICSNHCLHPDHSANPVVQLLVFFRFSTIESQEQEDRMRRP